MGIGDALQNQGKTKEAINSYEMALNIVNNLISHSPEDGSYQIRKVNIILKSGAAFFDLRSYQQALSSLLRAKEILQEQKRMFQENAMIDTLMERADNDISQTKKTLKTE